MDQDVIELTSGGSDGEPELDRRALLEPVIHRVVNALGGTETGEYRLGDEVMGCLKDLKKLWRKDDTDDERTVARIFWETRVLLNDLVPILLATAGKGLVEDKRAIACADLITAITWPIDMAEELKELDEELDRGSDYTQLLESHLHYKAALLKPGIMQALFGIMLPPLAKARRERREKDGQIVNVVLHLIRNLAFINDIPVNANQSAGQAEFSTLQSKLIRYLSETHILQLLLTIASNADNDPLFNSWNTLVLEILYLLFRGTKPASLAMDQAKQPASTLHALLSKEETIKRELARTSTSRHSRFGTTITVTLNPSKKRRENGIENGNEADTELSSASRPFVLHRQQALTNEAGAIIDMTKKQKSKKANTVDPLARDDNLSLEARMILQTLATDFVEACFNPFLSALLKDIRSERAKITEKDNLRLLYVTKWFLEFFLTRRENEHSQGGQVVNWDFGLIAEVTDRAWIIWVLKRMREAVDEKPKLWTELQAGIECLTQLLLLIDRMSQSEIADPTLSEAADLLQQQLIYNGEVLDIAIDSLRVYKQGVQSLTYLESSVHLAYALLRMLESWGKRKAGDVYVRKKIKKQKKSRGVTEEDGIPDAEEPKEDVEDVVHETIFTLESFEMKFANTEITRTLLTYLARYKDFSSSENMRRVVSLMHRQVVKAKAEGLYFNVTTLELFKNVLSDQKSFPREQPYKDLINLVNYVLRKFFKALDEEPFLAIEAFFPKNRGHWKQYSSWEPEAKSQKQKKTVEDQRFPPDVEIKKGYSWSDQLGIAIAALVDADQIDLVNWTIEILTTVVDQRFRIILETDKNDGEQLDEDDANANEVLKLKGPSVEAMSKMTDYLIPYVSDEQANAANKHPHLKLLFRLSKFFILDEDADEMEWYVPAGIAASELQSILTVIKQFLETPIDLEGKKASELMNKKRRRRRRLRSPSQSGDEANNSEDELVRKKKKAKKEKEKQQYKSAQFIEDSDGEYGDMDAFLEKEKEMRERAILAAAASGKNAPTNMKATGTKKRHRKGATGPKKKQKGDQSSPAAKGGTAEIQNTEMEMEERSDGSDMDIFGSRKSSPLGSVPGTSTHKVATRPKPRPLAKKKPSPELSSAADDSRGSPIISDSEDNSSVAPHANTAGQRTRRLILSDED